MAVHLAHPRNAGAPLPVVRLRPLFDQFGEIQTGCVGRQEAGLTPPSQRGKRRARRGSHLGRDVGEGVSLGGVVLPLELADLGQPR